MSTETNTTACPSCGEKYERLGSHWQWNPEHRPSFTERQHEIITGVMLGDGYINRSYQTPFLKVSSTNETFIRRLYNLFGELSAGVSSYDNAEYDDAFGDSLVWEFRTVSHPELEEYASWYTSEQLRFPWDLELTPMVTKLWYVGDGNICVSETGSVDAYITTHNEADRIGWLMDKFPDAVDPTHIESSCQIYFNDEDARWLLDWMGPGLSSFERKFLDEQTLTPIHKQV